jgi:3-hydroxyisobutyrate dehydrogenase-like beta-hydroxyacid dehydrogenase
MNTVGFIGLGNIGTPMSQNLLRAGFDVIGFDLVRNPAFVEAGGRFAESVQDVGRQADVIVQSLPTAAALESVITGLLEVAREGQTVIDISGYSLEAKQQAAERLAQQGVAMLDCEISGLPFMVANRTAVIFQAGDEQCVNELKEVFDGMADTCFYLGKFGSATKMKLLANMMVAIHNSVGGEVLNLAARIGVDPDTAVKVLGSSAGGSVTFSNKAPVMISRDFEGGPGPFRHMAHYLDRAAEMARQAGAATPLLDKTREYYQIADEEDRGDQDIAAVIELLEAASTDMPKER